jgi:hypothetical protein
MPSPHAIIGHHTGGNAAPQMASRRVATSGPSLALATKPTPLPFMLGILLTSLLLQRFALPVGGFMFPVEMPVGLALGAWGLLTGSLGIDRRRFAVLLGLATTGLITTVVGFNLHVTIAPRPTLTSLANWFAITAFAALTFRVAVPEEKFFKLVNFCFAGIALAGVVQFSAQFSGLMLFSFAGIFPQEFLLEKGFFNTSSPIFYGSTITRSNGFFLVEPSIFSQFMAVAIAIEFTYFRRQRFLVLFFCGLLVSVSGTGWMVLAAFFLAQIVSVSRDGIFLALSLVGAAVIALIMFALVVPDAAAVLLSRIGEFQYRGTSGNERFVGPFLAALEVLTAVPWAALIGVGPGTSEHLLVSYTYAMNSPGKVLVEYGIIGLALYFTLLVTAERTRRQRALLAPVLTLLMLAGNWCQFSPVLFPMLLMITTARLDEEACQGVA